MKSTKTFLLLALSVFVLTGCDTEVENIQIQKPYEFDEQYYENLRAYKKTDHTLAFGWFAAYAVLEGQTGYKDPASWGERLIGLPDSLDVVSLWMGIPGNDPSDPTTYAPVAYADWKYVRKVKGTRFVATSGPKLDKTLKIRYPITIEYPEFTLELKKGDTVNLRRARHAQGEYGSYWNDNTSDAYNDPIKIDIYTDYLMSEALNNDLDGVDFDYEPGSDRIANNNGALFVRMVERAAKYFGPTSSEELNPERKMLIIDFYNHLPPAACGQYVNYYIRQAYTQGGDSKNATELQGNYDAVRAALDNKPEKFIVTEQISLWYTTGGSPFTEADGNTLSPDGSRMYSLEGMARWNPTQGRKGGFGGFYFDRDYHNARGPYYNMRRAIQAANPAVLE